MVTYERKKDKDTITIDRGVWWGRTSTKWELKIDDNSITATRRKTFEQYFVAVILMLIGGFYFVVLLLLFLLVIISLINGDVLFEAEEIPILVVWVIHAVVMSGGALFLYKNIYWKKPEKDVKKYLEEYVA